MQTTINFNTNPDDIKEPFFATGKDIKEGLNEYIKTTGLVKFKDYYMSIKLGKNPNIPGGIEKEHFLEMVKDVYVTRAKGLAVRELKKAA